jgi:hypothetical protein
MKRFLFVAMLSIGLGGTFSYSQDAVYSSDTLVYYSYASPTDSIDYLRDVHLHLDSVNYFQVKQAWERTADTWTHKGIDSLMLDHSGHSRVIESWHRNSENEFWERRYREIDVFLDSVDKRLSSESWEWDPVKVEWKAIYRWEWDYNDFGQQILHQTCSWDDQAGDWSCTNKNRFGYRYGEDDRILSDTFFIWESDTWVGRTINDYSYDTAGFSAEVLEWTWNAAVSEWELTRKSVPDRDDQGQYLGSDTYNYEGDPLDWRHSGTVSIIRDNSGRKETINSGFQFSAGSDWSYFKTIRLYSPHGLLTWEKNTYRTGETGEWSVQDARMGIPGPWEMISYDTLCSGQGMDWYGSLVDMAGRTSKRFESEVNTDSICTLDLYLHEKPAAFSITDTESSTEICQGQTVYYAVPENPSVEYSWWSIGGDVLSGQGNDTLQFQWLAVGQGELFASSENVHGCISDTATLQVDIMICNSVEEGSQEDVRNSGLMLYPVPASDYLWIRTPMELSRVELLDVQGRAVLTAQGADMGMDISAVHAGVYFLRVYGTGGIFLGSQRVVKH